MHHTGRVVSRTELVEHLYDQDFDRDSNTIEVFVGRIRKKLGVDVIQTVRGLGYLLTPPSSARWRCALIRSRCACSSRRRSGPSSSWSSPASCCRRSTAQAVERAFDRRLGVYLRTLVADVAAPEEGDDKFPQSLGEPLFELPLSGWYWQVTRLDAREARRALVALAVGCRPAASRRPERRRPAPDGTRQGYVEGPEDQRLRLVERTIDLGDEGRYLVAVAGDAAEIDDETRSFDRALVITFGVLADRAAADHHVPGALRPGAAQAHLARASPRSAPARAERLEGAFPGRDRAARARDQRADRRQPRDRRARAHPCRQSRACAEDAALGDGQRGARTATIRSPPRCASRPTSCATRSRAISSARGSRRAPTVVGTVTEVAPVVTALARTMEKIHRDRGIAIDIDAPDAGALPRRAAGPRGDGRQPRRQCLQMGAVARRDRGRSRNGPTRG